MAGKFSNPDLIFGLHPVQEALEAGKEINKVMVQRGLRSESAQELVSNLRHRNVYVQEVPLEKLNRLTRKNHQGVVAFIAPIIYHDFEQFLPTVYEAGRTPLILALDKLTDTRNLGAIARTAECAGVDAIIIPDKESAQVTSDAVRTSAGALMRIPVCRTRSLTKSVRYAQNSGLQVVACTEKSDQQIYAPDFKLPTVIVMGSEEYGVSDPIMKMADHLAAIPMLGAIGSLNVSVACGVILYELIRQRQE